MTTLVTRASNASPLSFEQMDGNLNEIERRTGQGWNDLVSDVSVTVGSAAPNQEVFRGGIVCYSFPPDTIAECFANFHLRHDYIPATMVYPHVHWTCNTADTGVIRWGVEWTFARRGDSGSGVTNFGPTQTLYIEHTVSAGDQYRHHVNESANGLGIYHADLEVDAVIMCRFFRDAAHPNDTFTGNALLLTVDIHYECDVASTPLRFPPFK